MIGETAPAVARLQPRQVAVTATECPQDTEPIYNTGRLTAAPLLHLSVEPIGHVLGDVARKRLARVGAQDSGEFRRAKYLALRQLILGQRQAAHAELPIKFHEAIRSLVETRKRRIIDVDDPHRSLVIVCTRFQPLVSVEHNKKNVLEREWVPDAQ